MLVVEYPSAHRPVEGSGAKPSEHTSCCCCSAKGGVVGTCSIECLWSSTRQHIDLLKGQERNLQSIQVVVVAQLKEECLTCSIECLWLSTVSLMYPNSTIPVREDPAREDSSVTLLIAVDQLLGFGAVKTTNSPPIHLIVESVGSTADPK